MLLLTMVGCMAKVHVQSSVPGAEVGLISQVARPSEAALSARHRGRGEVRAKVPFSVFDTWWAWVRADGYETAIVKLPQTAAAAPSVSCAGGVVVPPLLAGCFFVTRPKRGTLLVELVPLPPRPDRELLRAPPPAAVIRPITD